MANPYHVLIATELACSCLGTLLPVRQIHGHKDAYLPRKTIWPSRLMKLTMRIGSKRIDAEGEESQLATCGNLRRADCGIIEQEDLLYSSPVIDSPSGAIAQVVTVHLFRESGINRSTRTANSGMSPLGWDPDQLVNVAVVT